MRGFPRWLCRTCWGWRFYLIGMVSWSVIELVLYLTSDAWQFIDITKRVTLWSIALTICYKVIVSAIMIQTRPKTTLDRSWIWHLMSTLSLFLYAFIVNVWPEAIGLPRPGIPPEGQEPMTRTVIGSAILFQIWGSINWSALKVLIETWNERGRFVWNRYGRFTRSLRTLSREPVELP